VRVPAEVASLLETHRRLSKWNALFVEEVLEVKHRADLSALGRVPTFDASPLNSWPTFVDSSVVEEMAGVTSTLLRLVRSVPKAVFGDDAAQISTAYDLPLTQAAPVARILSMRERTDATTTRGDLLLTPLGFKVCELNFGLLGGLASKQVALTVLDHEPVKRFVAKHGLVVRDRDPAKSLCEHILRSSRTDDADFVLAFVLNDDAAQTMWALFESGSMYVGAILEEVARQRGCKADVVLARRSELEIHERRVSARGRRVHALVVDPDSWGHDTPLLNACAAGDFFAVNGPEGSLLGDKLTFALVSEAAESGRLSQSDRDFVRAHVPWTRSVARVRVTYRGASEWLPDLLVRSKDDFVLKPRTKASDGSNKGLGVVVGCDAPSATWENAVATALSTPYVVQEVIRATPLLYEGREGVAKHGAVWGPFIFGNDYGGSLLRILPLEAGERVRVINSSLGAVDSALIEIGGGD
jgi:hypothetical protein